MTIMHFDTTSAAAQQETLYLGGFNNAYSGPVYSYAYAEAGFRWDSNTYVYAFNNVSSQTLIGGDSWVTPRLGLTTSDYQIRWHETQVTGTVSQAGLGIFKSTGWNEATWLDLGTDKDIRYYYSFGSPYQNPQEPQYIIGDEFISIDLNVEIRFGDGSNTSLNPNTSAVDGDNYAALGFYNILLGFPV